MFTGVGGGGPFGAPALAGARGAALSSSEFSISSLDVIVRALPLVFLPVVVFWRSPETV